MGLRSKKGELAIAQPVFKKIEARLSGGIATIAQRTEVIAVALLMDYNLDGHMLIANRDKVIVRGDAGLATWAKTLHCYNGVEFVLCPESQVLGFELNDGR